jgi:hypothetical protein
MIVEFKGGPCDGITEGGFNAKAEFIMATGHGEKPIYMRNCCSCCAEKLEIIDYIFVGYEGQMPNGSLKRLVPAHRNLNQD